MQPPPQTIRRSNSGKKVIIVLFILALVFIFLLFVGTMATAIIPTLRGRVALLEVRGTIYDAREFVEELHYYMENSTVRAIVIRIESPGGSAAASQELYDEIRKIRAQKTKPIIASMGGIAASGGYYIACGAEEIYANPATLTGSIGVVMNLANWETLVKKVGIRFEVIKSGEYKDIGSPNRPMTDKERELLQDVIDDVYNQFIEAVYDSRRSQLSMAFQSHRLEEEDSSTSASVKQYLRNLADGRIFTGRLARDYGLVDRLGNLDDAIKRAAVLGGIRGRPKVFVKKKRKGLLNFLQGKFEQTFRNLAPEHPSIEYRYVPR